MARLKEVVGRVGDNKIGFYFVYDDGVKKPVSISDVIDMLNKLFRLDMVVDEHN